MTVATLEESMSAAEFGEWVELLSIEPWGPYRDDVLTALIRSSSLAPWCGGKIPLEDLIPKWGQEPKKRLTWRESVDRLFAFFGSSGPPDGKTAPEKK